MKQTPTSQPAAHRGWRAGLLGAAALLLTACGACEAQAPQTAVQQYGQLKVSGNKIVDKNNQPVSLAGNSLFWSNPGWGPYNDYYNANTVGWLKNSWNAKIVRIAMGVEEGGQGGRPYLFDKAANLAKVRTVVNACLAQGIYVIIDWHTHHAEDYQAEAITFFKQMATEFGDKPNVIYEVYNEPRPDGATEWNNVIKPYAEAVAGAIRAIDPDNLIIVGTPLYSQRVDLAADNPITKYSNIAYTLHFYAAFQPHQQPLIDIAQKALDKGVALFVTEWGTVQNTGAGAPDPVWTEKWMTFLKKNSISHANWAMVNKDEGASALVPGAPNSGPWSDSYLTASGKLVKGYIQNWNGTATPTPPTPQPPTTGSTTKVEAESYNAMNGVRTQPTTDTGGGLNVGYLDAGDWMAYTITVPTAGTYRIDYRVASLNGGGRISLEQNSGTTFLGTVTVPKTNGWQTWTTISQTVTLQAGRQDIAIGVPAGGYNVNWWSFTKVNSTNRAASSESVATASQPTTLALYPNPTQEQLTVTLPAADGTLQLTVFNAQGRAVISRAVAGQPGAQQLRMPIAALEPGSYLVQVSGSGTSQTSRFVIQ
ncbi:cellulase family glycosylhydrolase [Hymenobacter psychrophilus]|uniref:Endoglucanase n=1 Tax=Hymenobacter psychrophilus TaxID=651662 RepID=A0A1H3ARN4_9BACT|nr:cellulase family glycosylhydrolase [Hymenobacter psychrophilus]SDX32336.1 endoglucanase [Hymenobacter psychrophilus]